MSSVPINASINGNDAGISLFMSNNAIQNIFSFNWKPFNLCVFFHPFVISRIYVESKIDSSWLWNVCVLVWEYAVDFALSSLLSNMIINTWIKKRVSALLRSTSKHTWKNSQYFGRSIFSLDNVLIYCQPIDALAPITNSARSQKVEVLKNVWMHQQ